MNYIKVDKDYLARVNDQTYPKYKAAELAKKYDIDYWDGPKDMLKKLQIQKDGKLR